MKEIICIDIDGVLSEIKQPIYSKAKPIKDAKKAINLFKDKGYAIYFYTGRHILKRDETVEWLSKHGLNYDHIVFNKPVAKYYIDDNAIRFDNWGNVIKKIKKIEDDNQ